MATIIPGNRSLSPRSRAPRREASESRTRWDGVVVVVEEEDGSGYILVGVVEVSSCGGLALKREGDKTLS